MGEPRPIKPSDPRIQGIRLQHPTDSTKVIQLELVDTGLLTADNIERWSIASSSGGGPLPAVPSENKHYYYELPDTNVHALADIALVSGGVLIADDDNIDPIVVGGDNSITDTTAPKLPAGMSIPISALNLSQIFVKGTAGDIITFIGG